MHADELRQAVAKVVGTLKRSDVRTALDRYRSAKGEERTEAAARLGEAGATIMEGMEGLSPAERRVARLMHLELLGSPDYWQSLLDASSDPKTHQAEIVRLASRVMFSTGQLPALIALLEATADNGAAEPSPAALEPGEARFAIRLADAGEKASDPDRIARSIDGIDMLYSACASIARKPAMDLRLDGIDGGAHRDLRFTGERDSLSAVVAVIESIPAALADVDSDGDIDLEAIIGSLPVFEDLRTLGSIGTFSSDDMKDISETMHQGALLVLESGVVLLEQPPRRGTSDGAGARGTGSATIAVTGEGSVNGAADDVAARASEPEPSPSAATTHASVSESIESAPPLTATPNGSAHPGSNGEARPPEPEGDEHYEHYLRERETMRKAGSGDAVPDVAGARRSAVEELLRSLEQTRNG